MKKIIFFCFFTTTVVAPDIMFGDFNQQEWQALQEELFLQDGYEADDEEYQENFDILHDLNNDQGYFSSGR